MVEARPSDLIRRDDDFLRCVSARKLLDVLAPTQDRNAVSLRLVPGTIVVDETDGDPFEPGLFSNSRTGSSPPAPAP